MKTINDPFGIVRTLEISDGEVRYFSLEALEALGVGDVSHLPKSLKILLEAALRHLDGFSVRKEDVETIASWRPEHSAASEIPFKPARVVLQDFTGVPSVVDLAALREACRRLGTSPSSINPRVPCDLVVDHSVQVDYFGSSEAFEKNLEKEFERNRERYEFLKWGQQAFDNFRVVPPGTGIVHQVNLEHFATVVCSDNNTLFPDSLVGTDSHTPMINALGILGWGVGGIEAEAVMLGQPIYMLLPEVVGVRLSGVPDEKVNATDLVLTVTEMLRKEGVVGSFVEFYGSGMKQLSLPDRATVSNMAPEFGATAAYFPVDEETLDYLTLTNRQEYRERVERYCKGQGLWHEEQDEPRFSRAIDLDLGSLRSSLSGPKRPQDRIDLTAMQSEWQKALRDVYGKSSGDLSSENASEKGDAHGKAPDPAGNGIEVTMGGKTFLLGHGDVVIAAITSCTNTSNPETLVSAAMLARNARARGLDVKPWVKTSFAPGSRVVIDYLQAAGLMDDLEALGFANVGFGCTTCIGNSGPLPQSVAEAVTSGDLVVASVLSGNRNFEGRINPLVKANYLASPLLVVAYAIAGTVSFDFDKTPLGIDAEGKDVYLHELWPEKDTVRNMARSIVRPGYFRDRYAAVHQGTEQWHSIGTIESELYEWDPASEYIKEPPFFQGMKKDPAGMEPVTGARCLALFGDSVTTDHISPAGAIQPHQPAGKYLLENGVDVKDFNSFGSRRGNHEVMMRGTFDNIRVRNLLAPGAEGGFTTFFADEDGTGEVMTIFDASVRYRHEGVPLIVIAGKDYGMGSSRDWAAKGTRMLGVRAVIAESYERIHRSNLVGMGVLPLQFLKGESAEELGISGQEVFAIHLDQSLEPGACVHVEARDTVSGKTFRFSVECRIDSSVEKEYYRNGGILHAVLRGIAGL